MRFTAPGGGAVVTTREYYSVGGGFVLDEDETGQRRIVRDSSPARYPFPTDAELLARCRETGLPISQVMLANGSPGARAGHPVRAAEDLGRDAGVRRARLPHRRRAARRPQGAAARCAPATGLASGDATRPPGADRLGHPCALAVNEENASGGRVVSPDQRCCGHHPGGAALLPAIRPLVQRRRRGAFPPHGRGDRRCCSRKTPPSPVPKSAARVRSAQHARWHRPASPRCSAAHRAGRERRRDRHRAQSRSDL